MQFFGLNLLNIFLIEHKIINKYNKINNLNNSIYSNKIKIFNYQLLKNTIIKYNK